MKAPCKDCPRRSKRCHTTCGKYREFETANAERREAERAEKRAKQSLNYIPTQDKLIRRYRPWSR